MLPRPTKLARLVLALALAPACSSAPAPAREPGPARRQPRTPTVARTPTPEPELAPLPSITIRGSSARPTEGPVATLAVAPPEETRALGTDEREARAPLPAAPRQVAALAWPSPDAPPAPVVPGAIPFLAAADLEEVRAAFPRATTDEATAVARHVLERARAHVLQLEPRDALGCFAWASILCPDWEPTLGQEREGVAVGAAASALARGDSPLAVRVARTLAGRSPRRLYLEGRLAEARGELEPARAAYEAAVASGGIPELAARPLPLVRELARRSALGLALGDSSPGVSLGWDAVDSEHFTVVFQPDHRLRPPAPLVEEALQVARERLGIPPARLALLGRVSVYVFATDAGYHGHGAPGWSSGFACDERVGGPIGRTIATYAAAFTHDTLQHEIAHVLVHETWPGLAPPTWANEGAACYAESESLRQNRRHAAGLALGRGQIVDVALFFERDGYDLEKIGPFYEESSALFEELVARTGSVERALAVAARVAAPGGDLRGTGLDLAELSQALVRGIQKAASKPWAETEDEATPFLTGGNIRIASVGLGGLGLSLVAGAALLARRRAARRSPAGGGAMVVQLGPRRFAR